ncbi:MAG: response regulator transcription factor [Spirochaetes bacterium]|nr:response regulator transcription factor [Spirochaetota bacterium]
MNILIIEDNMLLRDNIAFFLKKENYIVETADDGQKGYELALMNKYDLIILDLMLPKMDGMTLVKYLKVNNINTPILVLSAKSLTEDKVNLLNLGCDDYLTKPFVSSELLARVRSILRRTHNISSAVIQIADLEIDTNIKKVKRGDNEIELTSKEYMMLEFFAYNKDKIVTRTEIGEHIWGKNTDLLTMSNSIDVHIKNLRKKIDSNYKKKILHTKRGFGFILTDKEI